MRGVIIQNYMQRFPFRAFAVEFLQKRYKVFALVFLVHFPLHVAGKHIQRGEYRCRAVPEVIGALAGGNARTQRQKRSAPLESLYLRFFVYTQHYRVIRRVQI